MANGRKTTDMTDEEVWAHLDACANLQVATLNRDGSPNLSTLNFLARDGEIFFDSYIKSQKVVNLIRDPRVAVLAEKGLDYSELRGVSINGRAEVMDVGPASLERQVQLRKRYDSETPTDVLEKQAREAAGKRVLVRVVPERMFSWDYRKLG